MAKSHMALGGPAKCAATAGKAVVTAALLMAGAVGFAHAEDTGTTAPEPVIEEVIHLRAESDFWKNREPVTLSVSPGFLINEAQQVQPGFTVESGPDLMRTVLGISPAHTRLEASGLLASSGPDSTIAPLVDPFARLRSLSTKNLGATVGYRGFKVSGSYLDLSALDFTAQSSDKGLRAWQAGLGYETGSLGLALSYETTAAGLAGMSMVPVDEQRWSFGGSYSITPAVRVDANAYYISRDDIESEALSSTGSVEDGPGAHLGVRLKF